MLLFTIHYAQQKSTNGGGSPEHKHKPSIHWLMIHIMHSITFIITNKKNTGEYSLILIYIRFNVLSDSWPLQQTNYLHQREEQKRR